MGGSLAVALGAGAIFATASCTSSVAQELDGAPAASAETESDSENVFIYSGDRDMSFAVTVDGETFSFNMDDMPPMPPMPAMPMIPGFDGMVFEQDGNSFHMEFDTEKLGAMEDSPEFAEWESKMEAWGEEMEAWGETVEAQAEAWADEMEPHIEAWADAQASQWEDRIELFVERAEADADRAEAMVERAEARAERDRERAEAQAERDRERAERRAEIQQSLAQHNGSDDGVTAPETRDFGSKSFDKVEVGGGITMVFTQDPNASVTATLERGSWDQVNIEVDGDTLIAQKSRNSQWGQRAPKLTVYASAPNLTAVDASSGATFKGNVIANNLEIDASSGSVIDVEGACQMIDIDASSGSNVTLQKLECSNADIDASSGSRIMAFASTRVDADASSGSSISVSGNPGDVKQDTSSGAVVRIR
ncbi:MAG: DUF2807 domain-containing protein [Pseudomonadota bacterium]